MLMTWEKWCLFSELESVLKFHVFFLELQYLLGFVLVKNLVPVCRRESLWRTHEGWWRHSSSHKSKKVGLSFPFHFSWFCCMYLFLSNCYLFLSGQVLILKFLSVTTYINSILYSNYSWLSKRGINTLTVLAFQSVPCKHFVFCTIIRYYIFV